MIPKESSEPNKRSTGRKRVVIIGAGPAGLMAATQLRGYNAEIVIVDQKSAPGRKFLVAGNGGFNLTHSEPLETFLQKYDAEFIRSCVRIFPPEALRKWLLEIGIETIVGSSGKVFPLDSIRPIEVLNAWLKLLEAPTISWRFKTTFTAFTDKEITLQSAEKSEQLRYDYLLFATGGASWKKTGSDGKWTAAFDGHGIPLKPFEASNSGLEVFNDRWLEKYEGAIIKNVRLQAGETVVAGDLTVTEYGIEGKPVYAVNNWLRHHSMKGLFIDFKPQLSPEQVVKIVKGAKNVREAIADLKLSGAVYHWLREELSKEAFTDPQIVSQCVKQFRPQIRGFRPVDEVISTVGGVSMEAVGLGGKLHGFENVYCCGEMLDWDAPTGGYLLQACFSTGYVVGRSLRLKLE